MKKTNRPCWWCGKPLMAVSHAVLSDGRKVHKCCQQDAEAELRMVTARPKSADEMDAMIEDQLGSD